MDIFIKIMYRSTIIVLSPFPANAFLETITIRIGLGEIREVEDFFSIRIC